MSVIHKKETVCGCCGKLVQVDVIASTSIFGYPDLDFRPPEGKRSTMPYWVQECPFCGYVFYEIGDAAPFAKQTVLSYEYGSLKDLPLPGLAKRFLRLAAILENTGDGGEHALQETAQAYLCAAWDCDDHREHTAAKALRKEAALLLEQCSIEQSDELSLLLCDLYRRSEQYDRLSERFSSVQLKDPTLQKILETELILASAIDNDRYRFAPEGKVQRDTVFLAPIEEDEDGFHLHLPGPKAPLDYF